MQVMGICVRHIKAIICDRDQIFFTKFAFV